MSVKGPQGGRGRSRGRGHSRGKESTLIWEWEAYTPGPEVYDNIWHVRQEPVTVTPLLPNECPIPDARTRILERRQTEDGFGRNYYFVEITYLGGQEPTSTWVQSSDNVERLGTEVERVYVNRILQYVSPRELERFENEQFRIEAEAQAVAEREEEEEQVRTRMKKNARMAGSKKGKGKHTPNGFGKDPNLQFTGKMRGQPRSKGKDGMVIGSGAHGELPPDEIVHSEPSQTDGQRPPTLEDEVVETSIDLEDIESEKKLPKPASPGLKRSALVANSALPISQVQQHRPAPTTALRRGHPEVPDIGDSDTVSERDEDGFMSSAAMQLHFEGKFHNIRIVESDSLSSHNEDAHRSKKRKMDNVEPQQELMSPPPPQIADTDTGRKDNPAPADLQPTIKAFQYHSSHPDSHTTPHVVPSALPDTNSNIDNIADNSEYGEDAEELYP